MGISEPESMSGYSSICALYHCESEAFDENLLIWSQDEEKNV